MVYEIFFAVAALLIACACFWVQRTSPTAIQRRLDHRLREERVASALRHLLD